MTPLARRFAQEYVVDLNGAQAYLRANPRVSYDTAVANASRLLANANVAREVSMLIEERAARTRIEADAVLQRLWQIATADPRKLAELHVIRCADCWQLGNGAEGQHEAESDAAGQRDRVDPQCRSCHGRGQPQAVFRDSRTLEPEVACLVAGIRNTPSGPEYRIHDQLQALVKVGEHLGMFRAASHSRITPAIGTGGQDGIGQLLRELRQMHGLD